MTFSSESDKNLAYKISNQKMDGQKGMRRQHRQGAGRRLLSLSPLEILLALISFIITYTSIEPLVALIIECDDVSAETQSLASKASEGP